MRSFAVVSIVGPDASSGRHLCVDLDCKLVLSQKAQYAFKALLALAKADRDEVCLIADIASSQNIPRKFLEQILLDLRHHGIVFSRRGKAGGYKLGKSPDLITFGEVLRIVDGPTAPLPCLSRTAYRRCEGCEDEEACELRRVFSRVANANRQILDLTTLSDAVSGATAPVTGLAQNAVG